MCKENTGEYVEVKQINASGKETITNICKNKPSKKKGPKLLTANKICVTFVSNDTGGSKKRTVEINGGLITKEKYKMKKQKIMARSGRKSIEEYLGINARGLGRFNTCLNLQNEMTTPMLNMKIPRTKKNKSQK